VNGEPVRPEGYEVHAAFGALTADECLVVGDFGNPLVGSSTDITVTPIDADSAGRRVGRPEAVCASITGPAEPESQFRGCGAATPQRRCSAAAPGLVVCEPAHETTATARSTSPLSIPTPPLEFIS
jgi:hypothetical protein